MIGEYQIGIDSQYRVGIKSGHERKKYRDRKFSEESRQMDSRADQRSHNRTHDRARGRSHRNEAESQPAILLADDRHDFERDGC